MNIGDRESTNFSCSPDPWQSFGSEHFNFSGQCDARTLEVILPIDVDSDPTLQSINLTTSVSDLGYSPSMEAVGYVYLTFYDINDNTPQFTGSSYMHAVNGQLSIPTFDLDPKRNNEYVKYGLNMMTSYLADNQWC